jgi:hypothetical protein
MKIDANLMTTGSEILRKVNNKLQNIMPEEMFEPKQKSLKVKNLW